MKSNNKIILLSANDNLDQVEFKQIYSIAPEYLGDAFQMARFFQNAIIPENLKFDFNKALNIVNEHPELAVVGTLNQTISQQTDQVSVMIDKVVELIKNVLGVVLPDSQTGQYKEAITQAFTNLNVEKGDAWIFWEHEEAHKTTYQYNIFFAIQNQSTGSVMLGLPMGLTITVNIDKEKVLFITVKDRHEYSVNIQAIQVVKPLSKI